MRDQYGLPVFDCNEEGTADEPHTHDVVVHYVDHTVASSYKAYGAADAVKFACYQLDTCDEVRDVRIVDVDGNDDTGRLLYGYKRPAVREAR